MPNEVTLKLPANSTIKMTGFTSSAHWGQKIALEPAGGSPVEWTGTGPQDNKVIGQLTLAKSPQDRTLTVKMFYDNGGWKGSDVVVTFFDLPGLSCFVVGGQDGGGRPNGPAYWNTVLFIYWAKNY